MFRFSDVYGLIGAMFVLVFVYLILNNSIETSSILNAGANATTGTLKTLQGR
jgi:uncharacterized membrane protein YoaK (UPF0700 family)